MASGTTLECWLNCGLKNYIYLFKITIQSGFFSFHPQAQISLFIVIIIIWYEDY